MKLANKILDWHTENCTLKNTHLLLSDVTFLKLKDTNPNVILSTNLCMLIESWSDTNDIIKWLIELENTPITFQKDIFLFIQALFLKYFEIEDISLKCLHILINSVMSYQNLTNNLLILLLYKLANTRNSKLHLEILKALPKLTIRDENVVLIRLTIESLSKSSRVLYNFSMFLMFEMWKRNNKFYGHLEKMLAEPQDAPNWKYYVNKSVILKEICKIR